MERILPGEDETQLLRTILHRGDAAHEAWRAFQGGLRDLPSLFRTDTGNRKRLSPLLLHSIRENRLDADPALLTILKTATLREELRVSIVRRIAGEVYGALRSHDLPFLVLKGAALSESVYDDPTWRHAHDIDLLLPPDMLDRAAAALAEVGLQEAPRLQWAQGRDFRHTTELPFLLLSRLYRVPFYRAPFERLYARGRTLTRDPIGAIRVLDPTDALLHCLGHASYCPGRSNLLWVVDAWMLLRHSDPVDWDSFEDRLRDMRLEVPVATMVRYLAEEVGAPIPEAIVAETARGLSGASGLQRDVALFGARQAIGRHPGLRGRRPLPWWGRFKLMRWALLPSLDYLDWAYGRPPRVTLPLLYLTRPVSALAERMKWALVRAVRRRS
jgi:hypothetical protein